VTDQPTIYDTAQIGNVSSALRELRHPTQIGPYSILSLIGEGGMGTVYKAEQRAPIHRIVAIKIIKLGMDTREVIARFESERQALALMNHPNVAKVLDAGATDAGRPYFVMEYVAGEPITTFADRHKLTVRQRLDLFTEACNAVQHAHQKAIIHRDLKPSNILVALIDSAPHVKVIDFGVAKAISHRLTERTLFTEAGQLVGTPEYMAPEQAEGTMLDVDTRADVYSLGVVLYELLSGTLPFDPKSLRSAGYQEIQRIIREVDPPRPSTRLADSHDTLASVAASRQVEAHKLGTLLRGELDWIVMKSLEKDRTRRYESASALAEDVHRYLSDEPVSAGPPSGMYRARKFVRRHKLAFAMAAALAIALAAGLVGTTWGFVNARRQRDAAVAARNDAVAARDDALAARRAEAAAREYETQTDKFLIDMFTSIDPEKARGRDVLVKDILDNAAKRIDTNPPNHKIVEAYVRSIFGSAYQVLGVLDQAQAQLERSVALETPTDKESRLRLAGTLNYLGATYKELGRFPEAEAAYRRAADLQRASLSADDPELIWSESNVAVTLIAAQKLQEGETMLSDIVARLKQVKNPDPYLRATVVNNLALLRAEQGRAPEAESMLRDALADIKANSGEDHPASIALLNNLADLLRQQGKFPQAAEMLASALRLSEKINGPGHPNTLMIANNLGLAYKGTGQFAEAEKLYRNAIERRRRALGEDDPGTLLLRSNYGLVLQAMDRLAEAEAEFTDALEHMKRAPENQNPADRVTLESNLAWVRCLRGDVAGAEAMYRKLLPEVQKVFDPQSPAPIIFGMKFGCVLVEAKKWTDAEPLLSRYYQAVKSRGAPLDAAGAWAYGLCLVNLDKSREALPILEEGYRAAESQPRREEVVMKRIADAAVLACEKLGNNDEAEKWRRRK
jgi:serine/threonine protein kinase/Flp pilus assembly protein TadD